MKRKIIKRSELSKLAMVDRGEKKVGRVIMDGNVYCWVGIGWVNEGPPTDAQRFALPVVKE